MTTALAVAAGALGLAEVYARRGGRAWDPTALGMWAILGLAAATWMQHPPAPNPERVLGGGGLLVLAVGLRAGAVVALGPRWRGADGALVRDGVYGQVRHPGAVATVLAAAGAALLLGSGPALAATFLAQIPLVIWVTRHEERALASEFEEAWRAYKAEVPSLVPRPRWL